MKYKVKNDKPKVTLNYTLIPNEMFDFKLNANAFKVLVWLMHHKDGLDINEYFIKLGTGMDYRTFRKNLKILEDNSYITISEPTVNSSGVTISRVAINYSRVTNKQVLLNKY